MKTSLKKLFFWSSLGSVLFGTTVAVARRKSSARSNPSCQEIPPTCRRVDVWTELTEAGEKDGRVLYREHYVLRPTTFKVWSILDLPVSPGQPNPTGAVVYHVTCSLLFENPAGDESGQSEDEKSRFYGTVSVLSGKGRVFRKNVLARGAILEIRKCYVGGASNGVETGEVQHSSGPVLNYRFEYGPEAETR